ncbi:MAG: hypothetical protein WCP33_06230 [Deltaproteobacteria bacterium]
MPLQNRVTPEGNIVAFSERGSLMGNRGNLHNLERQVVRVSAHKSWVACRLEFQGIRRELMKPGSYTELFFLDEATAYSAGHRPCNDCQKDRLKEFRDCWIAANAPRYNLQSPTMPLIDGVLHDERIGKQNMKVTYTDDADRLPDGAFIDYEGAAYFKWQGRYLEWSAGGYVNAITLPLKTAVPVLTPKSIVRCFHNGLVPEVHISASKL